jgi:hypothetical protein
MNGSRFLRLPLLVSICLGATLILAGCSKSPSISAQFTASGTAPAPGLVKLVERSRSGSRVRVDVLLYGPEPGLDLFAFRFGIKIGNDDVVRLVRQSTYNQSALVAGDGQVISIDVDAASDPSLVQVDLGKTNGAGNAIDGPSAVVLALSFDVQAAGTSTLTLVGLDGEPPRALDARGAPIAAVHFDAASAAAMGVSGGGSGY